MVRKPSCGPASNPAAHGSAVAGEERDAADHRAADDPAQLAPRRHRAHASERAHHDRQAAEQAGREHGELEAIEHLQGGGEAGAVPARLEDAGRLQEDRGAQPAEQTGRQVEQRQHGAADRRPHPGPRPFGEDQREVQEQRRQQQQRHHVAPVEDPVEPIEAAAEREPEDAEERHREPEEVQRGLIAGPAQAHGAADQQREDRDQRLHHVEGAIAGRRLVQRQLDETLAHAAAEHGVGDGVARTRGVERLEDVGGNVDPASVDGDEEIVDR